MPKISISHLDQASEQAFPALSGLEANGTIRSRAVVSGDERPIHLWQHDLEPASLIALNRPPVGHTFYVWSGSLEIADQVLPEEAAAIVEHGGRAQLRAGRAGAKLLHFHRPESHPTPPSRAGGHLHLVAPRGIYEFKPERAVRIFADSNCPTCELWLHRSRPFAPNEQEGAHYHSADEIIFVLSGSSVVGRDELPRGSAIAIDAGTVYKFAAGSQGLSFLNFRPTEPWYTAAPRDGAPRRTMKDLELVQDFIVRRWPETT